MNESGVYVFFGPDDRCLYVGSSVDMGRRFASHPHKGLCCRVEYHPCPPEQRLDLEQQFIDNLQPSLNHKRAVALVQQPTLTGPTRTRVSIHVLLTQSVRMKVKQLAAGRGMSESKFCAHAIERYCTRLIMDTQPANRRTTKESKA